MSDIKSKYKGMSQKQRSFIDSVVSLKSFYNNQFAAVFPDVNGLDFVSGAHLDDICTRLQHFDRTTTIGARQHSKSTIGYAKCAWHALRTLKEPTSVFLISANVDMARYHTKIVREYLLSMLDHGLLGDVRFDNSSMSELIIRNKKTNYVFKLTPKGLFSKYRGAHPHIVMCEDMLGEPDINRQSVELKSAEAQFKNVISELPQKYRGELHIIGNAQTSDDIYFQTRDMIDPLTKEPIYNWKVYPAIIPVEGDIEPSEPTFDDGKPIWPELWSMQDLLKKYGGGRDSFMTQYMCRPMSMVDAFFNAEDFENEEEHWTLFDATGLETGLAFGGYDPGKSRHPAHACLFVQKEDGHLWQVESKWFNVGTSYDEQLNWIVSWQDNYTISKFYWDSARAELMLAYERGELPMYFTPYPLNAIQNKTRIAAAFKRYVQQKRLHIFDLKKDYRQFEQILVVNRDLKAPETSGGHGESFFTVGMTCLAAGGMQQGPANINYQKNPYFKDDSEQLWNELELSDNIFDSLKR